MVSQSGQRTLFVLSGLTILSTLVVSVIGIARPLIYQPFTPQAMLPGAMSQDIVSLLAALGLIVCIWMIRRGSWRGWLVWVGLNGYLFYAYSLYAFERLYNPLYLVYIALAGLTLYSVIFFFANADWAVVTAIDDDRLPRRAIGAFLLALTVMFFMLWMSMIVPGIRSKTPPDGASIFVMDLAFFLPLLVIVAVMLFRGKPEGAFLAPIVLVKIGTLGCSVLLGETLKPVYGMTIDMASLAVYALLGLGSGLFAVIALNRIEITRPAEGKLCE